MTRRCVLLFARSASAEGAAKGIPRAEKLFEEVRCRIADAARRLGVDLVVADAARQHGDTFGERLANAFAGARESGYGEIVAVPGDVPSLAVEDLAAAFTAVASGSLAVGPSPDGGIYLLGTSSDPSPLLTSVRWLTGHVAADLLRATRAAGLPLAVLRTLTDVDGRRSLIALLDDTTLDPLLRRLIRALLSPALPELDAPGVAATRVAPRLVSLRGPPVAT